MGAYTFTLSRDELRLGKHSKLGNDATTALYNLSQNRLGILSLWQCGAPEKKRVLGRRSGDDTLLIQVKKQKSSGGELEGSSNHQHVGSSGNMYKYCIARGREVPGRNKENDGSSARC